VGQKTIENEAKRPDAILKEYWRNNERFADIFNQVLFNGSNTIKPNDLNEMDTDESTIISYDEDGNEEGNKGKIKSESIVRHRDIIKSYGDGVHLVMVGIENQKHVHYAMPVRNMIYDGLNYVKQCKRYESSTKSKTTSDEFLSKMRKDDRINPVVTLVIYYGEHDEWDGPLFLSEMMEVPEEIKPYFNDYRVNIINVKKASSYDFKNEDNKGFFITSGYLYKTGKNFDINEFMKAYPDLKINSETMAAIGAATGSQRIIDLAKERKDKGIIMCDAIRAVEEKGEEKGKAIVNNLNKFLIKNNMTEELNKSIVDSDYQQELIVKYSITDKD